MVTWISDCDSHSSALLHLFLSSDASICSTMVFLHQEILIKFLSQFTVSKRDSQFYRIAYDSFFGDWNGLHDHLRNVPCFFKLSSSGGSSEFFKWVQVGMDVYIPHRKYQVKPHSNSMVFSS